MDAAYGDTCEWILEREQYLRWRDPALRDKHHGFFWIKGKPGVGKSTLMKFLFERFKQDMPDHTLVSFFFHQRGVHLQKSVEGMYRSMLFQLLDKIPAIRSRIEVPHSIGPEQIHNGQFLQHLFREAVLSLRQDRLIVVLDALDEGDLDEVRRMVQFLGNLAESARLRNVYVDICLASRHYPSISAPFSEELAVEDYEDHLKGIRHYVSDNLIAKLYPERRASVDEIVRRSRAVFLWVVLVVRLLNKNYAEGMSRTQLVGTLKDIPDDLTGLLNEILTNGASDARFLPTLQWVLLSEDLGLEALYFGVQIAIGTMTNLVWQKDDIDLDSMERFVVHSSKGLVEVQPMPDDDEWYQGPLGGRFSWPRPVQFIHESVREYLLDGGIACLDHRLDHDPIRITHGRLATWCQDYVRLDPSCYVEMSDSLFNQKIWNWTFHHIDLAFLSGALQLTSLKSFPQREWINKRNEINKVVIDHIDLEPEASLLYLLLEAGFYEVARVVLEACATSMSIPNGQHDDAIDMTDVHAIIGKSLTEPCGGEFDTPLVAAAYGCQVEIVLLLLRSGANINATSRTFGSPLSAAAARGRLDIVELLLESGANANTCVDGCKCPLEVAVVYGDPTIVERLLDGGADANVKTLRHGSLIEAAISGDLRASSSAPDHITNRRDDADVKHMARPPQNTTTNDMRIHQLLLERTRITDRKLLLDTLLREENDCYRSYLTKLLVQHGADLDHRWEDGSTDLCHLIAPPYDYFHSCTPETCRALLDAGADVDATGGEYGTALIAASARGNVACVKVLLEHNADIYHESGKHGTAVEAARAGKQHASVFESRHFDKILQLLSEASSNH